MNHTDVSIIGGGIIGCSIAYYLAKEGLNVQVLEKGFIAQGTTKAAGGMLGAHSEYIDEHFYSFARMSQQLYKQFVRESKLPFDYTTGGILQYVSSENELNDFKKWDDAIYINAKTFQIDYPTLATPKHGAYLFTDDVHVHPEKTCLAFYHAAKQLGAHFYEQTEVESYARTDNRVYITTGNKTYSSQTLIITSGLESKKLIPQLHLSATKGQCIQLDAQNFQLPTTLFDHGNYVIPRPDQTIVVGATMEHDSTSLETNLQGMASLQQIANHFSPTLNTLPIIRHWAGLRPKSIDGLPYIGQVPDQKNVYVAAGHYRNGILLAPATALLIKKLILNNRVSNDWKQAFRVERGLSHAKNHSIKWEFV